MAKFEIDFEGLNELQEILENMQNQSDNLTGNLSINTDLIMQNIDSFNQRFNTSFSANITNSDLQDYFEQEYLNIYEKHCTDTINYKDEFNAKFHNYAHID